MHKKLFISKSKCLLALLFIIFYNKNFGKINSQQIPGCEKEYFQCNSQRCSENSHCYYQTKDLILKNITEFSAECICVSGYGTYNMTTENSNTIVRCCYKLKDLYMAFIYECFLGFGFGYLYLGNVTTFLIKLIFQASICCIVCFSGFCLNYDRENSPNREKSGRLIYKWCNIFNFILIAIFIIWRIVDFFLFGLNLVKDKNGMPLNNDW